MIKNADRLYTKDEVMGMMEPLVSTWFNEKFSDLTTAQAKAIPIIHQRHNVLVSSPTGSGKTLTAFTSIINELVKYSNDGTLKEMVYCIYVSPLKALANDINRNLNTPLVEMHEVATRYGMNSPNIRIAVRSGDTPQNERQKMSRHPPHILITTPESLALILAAPKFKNAFKRVEWVIIDEIHDICDSKRGVFLSLSLERLRNHCDTRFIRIGLSATLAPVDMIATYLVGCNLDGTSRDVTIVESGLKKQLDLKVMCPMGDMATLPADVVSSMVYDSLKKLIDQHKTTLIFTNTRSGAENVVYKLKERGIDNIQVHHSSLDRDTRLNVEERLKQGDIKCVVSSTSLELGIDIGSVDLVCQIGSPKSVAKGLQRIGRSGHGFNKISKGRLIAFNLDDLVECAVMCRAAHCGNIDRVRIPENCLDILSQTIIGMSFDRRWNEKDAYSIIRGSYCYRNLPIDKFRDVLRYLGSKDDFEGVYSKIWYDGAEGQFGKKKGSRMIYFMNLGTIPEEANYRVITDSGTTVGEISEKFVERLSVGDVFVLGGRSFEFMRSRGMVTYVKEAKGKKPTVPSWAGEMLPRSFDLSMDIASFRGEIALRLNKADLDIISEIVHNLDVDEQSARNILSYFKSQYAVMGFIPDNHKLAIEEYIDPTGNQKIIFHFPFGRRVNDAISRAYAYKISNIIGTNVSIAISDDNFILGCLRKFNLDSIPGLIKADDIDYILRKSISNSEIFKLRFRHTATRSFMILRNYMGRAVSINRQQVKSSYLLEMLSNIDNMPVIDETYREVLEDDMDIINAKYILGQVDKGNICIKLIYYSGTPSPFAHSAILSGLSDVVMMEDKSILLKEFQHKVLYHTLGKDSADSFEFNDDQIVPYYTQKIKHVVSKEDIPRLLMDTGPLQFIRTSGHTIYTYCDRNKNVVDKWVKELINDGIVGTVYFNCLYIVDMAEIQYYAAATHKNHNLSDIDREIYSTITANQNISIDEISTILKISKDVVLRSIKKLESMYLITRTRISTKNKWFFSCLEYPNINRESAIDRIVLRYLGCFAPATVQEVAFFFQMEYDDIKNSLESLVATGEVLKGKFIISENEQYIIKKDYIRLKSGYNDIYDYDTISRYRVSKGRHFNSIKEFFEFYGSAGNELDVYNRVNGFDINEWRYMCTSGEILLGRFIRGRVRYVLKDDADKYAALCHEELVQEDYKVLDMISAMGHATMRQLVHTMGIKKDDIKQSITRLDHSLKIIRCLNDKEDQGTENVYVVYNHSTLATSDQAKHLLIRAIRAHGPISMNHLKFLVNIPIDKMDTIIKDIDVKTIYVGNERTPMLLMSEELPQLDHITNISSEMRLLSLYDPDVEPRWTEIVSRYGDKWVYPLMCRTSIVGALEIWEMSGCIEIRSIDIDSLGLLPEVLNAIDTMMRFYDMKGVDIVRIRKILNMDYKSLDSITINTLINHGYQPVNGFYAKGRFDQWTMSQSQMLSYVFRKQKISKDDKYNTVMEMVSSRGYIRGDQEIITHVLEKTTIKRQMDDGYLIKMYLTPPYQGYTNKEYAHIFCAQKGYVPDSQTMDIISIIKERQPISKSELIDNSPYSFSYTSSIISRLFRNSMLYQDKNCRYCLVQSRNIDSHSASIRLAKMMFNEFGIFTAENLSMFLDKHMYEVRSILRELEDEGFVKKGFFIVDNPTLHWMLSEDVGLHQNEFTDCFVLNTQDNLYFYMKDYIKNECSASRSVVFSGTHIIGSFKGSICSSGANIKDFEGSGLAKRTLREAARSVGKRIEIDKQDEDDEQDISEFCVKVNLGA